MDRDQSFDIVGSRLLALGTFLLGCFFLFYVYDMNFAQRVFDPTRGVQNPVIIGITNVVSTLVGLILFIRQGYFLIKPPVLLRVSRQGVDIGTGWMYKPYQVPMKLVDHARIFQNNTTLAIIGRTSAAGVEIVLKETKKIPDQLWPGAGVQYRDRKVRVFKTYMAVSPDQALEGIGQFITTK